MGLFWSMVPADGDPDKQWFFPTWPELAAAFEIQVAVTVDGREACQPHAASAVDVARSQPPGIPAGDRGHPRRPVRPPAGSTLRVPVLVFGGSEGGISQKFTAALLASHGHPALSLAYFRVPGLPQTLADIPLEYFTAAARLLARQPGLRPGPVAVVGYSRGSEVALLLAHQYPDLFRGVILYAPGATVAHAFPDPASPAWPRTAGPYPAGRFLSATSKGPSWPSPVARTTRGLRRRRPRPSRRGCTPTPPKATIEVLTYPAAGHGVATYPFQPAGVVGVHPVDGRTYHHGGTRATNAAARRDSWSRVIAFLAALP